MKIKPVNLKEKFKAVDKYWSPKIVGELNGQHVKIAKFKDEFVLHEHENEDELFLVLEGCLYIETGEETLEINEGEFVIIPKGTAHKPFAKEETRVLLLEPVSIINTGNIKNSFTVKNPDKI